MSEYAEKVKRDAAIQEAQEALPGRERTLRVSPVDRRGPKFGIPDQPADCVGNDCVKLHKYLSGK